MARRLVIDADSIIYKHAGTLEVVWPSEEQSQEGLPLYLTYFVEPQEVIEAFWESVTNLEERYEADDTLVALTDSARNFRLDIDPSYKGSRKHARKPLAVKTVRAALSEDPKVYFKHRLEADDVAGILMTMRKYSKDEMICWSIDKDMLTVPGVHVTPDGVKNIISVEEADKNHLLQTVTGDVTDGYPGLPGIGEKTGAKWFEKHGWTWEAAVKLAESKKCSEEHLLTQARLARILRATDYDFKKKQPILWTPG
jgi:DNA polymerase-1